MTVVDVRLGRPWLHMKLGGALLGDPQLQELRCRVDVPVAERLAEQLVDGLLGVRPEFGVVGVRLTVVVRRDLEHASGLDVDVPQLRPLPGQFVPAAAPGRDGSDQPFGVQQLLADARQSLRQRFRHGSRVSRAAAVAGHSRGAADLQRSPQETTI